MVFSKYIDGLPTQWNKTFSPQRTRENAEFSRIFSANSAVSAVKL
jgi:hypothetical protein